MTGEAPEFPGLDVILMGKVGSRLYGLERHDSDHDWKGVFQAPTVDVLSVAKVPENVSGPADVDAVVYEVSKFVGMALGCNPTPLEMLYLPEYEILTGLAARLVEHRDAFLCEPLVRQRYYGFARNQRAQVDKFEHGTAKYAKSVRHAFRVLEQGIEILSTGTMDPRVKDPERLFALGEQEPERVHAELDATVARFDATTTWLPSAPDTALVDWLLVEARHADLNAHPASAEESAR